MTQHEISMGYRIESMPPNFSRGDALRAMIDAVRAETGILPAGLRVTWTIRGKANDFGLMCRSGNRGLRNLMGRRLLRDLRETL